MAGAVAPTLKIDSVRLGYAQSANPADGGKLPAVSRDTGVWVWPGALVAVLAATLSYLLVRFFVKRRRARAAVLDTVPAPAA